MCRYHSQLDVGSYSPPRCSSHSIRGHLTLTLETILPTRHEDWGQPGANNRTSITFGRTGSLAQMLPKYTLYLHEGNKSYFCPVKWGEALGTHLTFTGPKRKHAPTQQDKGKDTLGFLGFAKCEILREVGKYQLSTWLQATRNPPKLYCNQTQILGNQWSLDLVINEVRGVSPWQGSSVVTLCGSP